MTTIICSAIWYSTQQTQDVHKPANIKTGYVMCGRRHHDIITLNHFLTGRATHPPDDVQGFMTNDNRFVTREEAYKIAVEAGQIVEASAIRQGKLYSEDLY